MSVSVQIFLAMFLTLGLTTAACQWQKAVVMDVVKTVAAAPRDYISALAAMSWLSWGVSAEAVARVLVSTSHSNTRTCKNRPWFDKTGISCWVSTASSCGRPVGLLREKPVFFYCFLFCFVFTFSALFLTVEEKHEKMGRNRGCDAVKGPELEQTLVKTQPQYENVTSSTRWTKWGPEKQSLLSWILFLSLRNCLFLTLEMSGYMQGWRSTGLFPSPPLSGLSHTGVNTCLIDLQHFCSSLCVRWFEICVETGQKSASPQSKVNGKGPLLTAISLNCVFKWSTGNLDEAGRIDKKGKVKNVYIMSVWKPENWTFRSTRGCLMSVCMLLVCQFRARE